MSNVTDKLIDNIIELILDDMDCHHEVDHEEDGTHLSVEYNLKDEKKLRGKIGALLKTGVTEEWIEEKARELLIFIGKPLALWKEIEIYKDFIRTLVEEIQHK